MHRRSAVLAAVCLAWTLGVVAPAPAAVDMYLDLEGIEGEAVDKTHAKEIDVLDWSWGVRRSPATRTRPAAGRPTTLTITKYLDKSTPELYKRVATGHAIAAGTLTLRKAGATPVDYFKLCMQNLQVDSLSSGGSSEADRLTEEIQLSGTVFSMTYTLQTSTGQSVKTSAGFDFGSNPAKAVTGTC